jgi:hypothetical protein
MESGDAEDVGRPASIDIDGSFNDGAFADIAAARPANAFKHHVADLLVSALVDSEDLTPIIKAVYRLDDFLPVLLGIFRHFICRRGLEKKFVVKLEDFQAKKAVEISDLCYSGYKSFVISVSIPHHVPTIVFDSLALR